MDKNRAALFKKLVEARKQIGGISKDSKNKHQGWAFRGYEALYAKARPVLDELGIWIDTAVTDFGCEVLDKGACVYGKFTVILTDMDTGESTETTVPMFGTDPGDKAAGKACSYAMKYALFTSLLIPTEEDMDATSPKIGKKKPNVDMQLAALKACKTAADLTAWKADAANLSPDEKSALADEFTLAVGRCK